MIALALLVWVEESDGGSYILCMMLYVNVMYLLQIMTSIDQCCEESRVKVKQ